ncbi:VWA domain-containing protein [Nocardioides acrostichi]|uniref:VWA domain-containing protein n=1 Tax=Nocardioides acrostichi TaxID=2784339 RepID=A0A930V2M2_9ACTN|nr:VWA domain-containing protein [Nocardioides acrostichi]MBF4162662.1 VWA domain-containing protein [Nocardioides acrostichi]
MADTLAPGQNVPLGSDRLTISTDASVDLIALVLSADGQVSGDADMVFYNAPNGAGVRLDAATLHVATDELRSGAERVALVASVDQPGRPLGTVTITDGPAQYSFTPSGLTTQTAVVLVEVYLRNGAWKLRAVGAGYDDGLAGLARDFGVDVADEAAPEPPAAPTAPTAAPEPPPTQTPAPISLIKGEERLPIDLRKKLTERRDLVKVSLAKRGASGLRARIIGVLDTSGSTTGLYKRGVFTRAVERIMAIAAAVDDDAEMQMFLMGSKTVRVDDLQVGDLPAWLARYTAKRPKQAGYGNHEAAAFEEVSGYLRGQDADVPTLVLWFHDGGVTDNRGTERAVRDAVEVPAFWQFVGLGRSNYGVLERLDDLGGRRVDNTGFFALDDIDRVADADLYERILSEFPSWVRAYYPPGHPAVAGLA